MLEIVNVSEVIVRVSLVEFSADHVRFGVVGRLSLLLLVEFELDPFG